MASSSSNSNSISALSSPETAGRRFLHIDQAARSSNWQDAHYRVLLAASVTLGIVVPILFLLVLVWAVLLFHKKRRAAAAAGHDGAQATRASSSSSHRQADGTQPMVQGGPEAMV